jgi:hypothetical protein
MQQVMIVTGEDLEMVMQELAHREKYDGVHTLRVVVDEGGVKFKVNNGVWSPALGGEEK